LGILNSIMFLLMLVLDAIFFSVGNLMRGVLERVFFR
jgi:hypothetical protein